MSKYIIGIDYGSENGRLVLVDVENGSEVQSVEICYERGNVAELLFQNCEYILHDPNDYLDIIFTGIPKLLEKSLVAPSEIIAIGIDSTTSSILPTDNMGVPLCFDSRYENNPHSYIKLWKDHSAQYEADRLNKLLNGERILSAEWLLPKVAHIYNKDIAIYNAASKFLEVSDWLVWYLTGSEKRSRSQAEFTSTWNAETGPIACNILEKFAMGFENVYSKLATDYFYAYESAGCLKGNIAERIGLSDNVFVAVSNIDAIATMAALGVTSPNTLVSVIGTSSCHLLHSTLNKAIPNAEKVKDTIIEGVYTYISSQVAVGDCFKWFYKNIVPSSYHKFANDEGLSIVEYMEKQLVGRTPAQGGCIALDCWNGLRKNTLIHGNIYGINVNTTPLDIYQSIIESTAFGLREIIENYESNGIQVERIVATGGVAHKCPIIMQIYSNVLGRCINISKTDQSSALGSAIYAATAVSKQHGGYDTLSQAARDMGGISDKIYVPDSEYDEQYTKIYNSYLTIKDFFLKNYFKLQVS